MIQTEINNSASFESKTTAITSYFSTLNQGKFELTAALFSEQGQLNPPFDPPVIGQLAIANYLNQEATDMSFNPVSETSQVLANEQRDVEVRGRVSTSAFSLNVVWNFLLSPDGEIDLVKVNLLASIQELMHLRPEKA